MCDERVEVAVAVEQRVIRFDAAGGDQRVHCLADGDATLAQCAIVARRLYCNVLTTDVDSFQPRQQLPRLIEIPLAAEALQHFGQDEVADDQQFAAKQCVQPVGLRGGDAPETVQWRSDSARRACTQTRGNSD
jgi:hypothetical protein